MFVDIVTKLLTHLQEGQLSSPSLPLPLSIWMKDISPDVEIILMTNIISI